MTTSATRQLRDVLGHFATGVTLITTYDGREPHGLTANSFSSVSLEPPLALFSLARSADCFDAFQTAETFGVNVLGADQQALSSRFATKDADKWSGVAWELGPGGCPLLVEGAIATFECRQVARHDGGDHIIHVGEVIEFEARSDGPPLLFFRGAYAGLDRGD